MVNTASSDEWEVTTSRRRRAVPHIVRHGGGLIPFSGPSSQAIDIASHSTRWTPSTLCAAISSHVHRLAHMRALESQAAHLQRWIKRTNFIGCRETMVATECTPSRLTCYGLGSVALSTASSNPVVQVAYFVILNRLLTALLHNDREEFTITSSITSLLARDVEVCEEGTCGLLQSTWACAHDPVFSDTDVTLLSAIGIRATRYAGCERCKTTGNSKNTPPPRILFFMPHCPWTLNSAVLSRFSWQCNDLSTFPSDPLWSVCIVGNSFASYSPSHNSPPSHFLRRQVCDAIELAAIGVETCPLPAHDAVAAVVSMCRKGDASNEDGCTCTWALDETPFDDAIAGRRGDATFVQALSSTSLHNFYVKTKG